MPYKDKEKQRVNPERKGEKMIDHEKDLGFIRSDKWNEIEKQKLALVPYCEACGSKIGLQVHHIVPFNFCVRLGRPALELSLDNLIVLCETERGKLEENHHLALGHFFNFKSGNINVRRDAQKYKNLTAEQIKKSSDFENEEQIGKLKEFEKMSLDEKKQMRQLIDQMFPIRANEIINDDYLKF